MDRLTHAKYFATMEHVVKRQQMYGVLPYTHHLADVERVLRDFNLGEDYYVAAWTHDVIEDCDGVKLKHVQEMFGDRVGELTWCVTNEPGGENRAARHAVTYPKIVATNGGVYLKLADRIAHAEVGGRLVDMYRKEHIAFKRAIRSELPDAIETAMWKRLHEALYVVHDVTSTPGTVAST
jgi:(p)ppGpp synthase/HD superfamily hydrolase